MSKKHILIAVLLFISLSVLANQTIYLSNVGSDNGDGTIEHPFYSLHKALEYRLHENRSDTLFIMVQPGEYYMDRPLVLDSPSLRSVVIRSEGKEKPCFLGGINIKGWEKYGDKLYRAYIPEVKKFGFTFEQFYVNEKRATLARTPNKDWYNVKAVIDYPFVKGDRQAEFATQKIGFKPEEWSILNNTDEDLSNLKFRFYHKWSVTHKRTEYIHLDSAFIYTEGEGLRPWNPITKGSRYIMYDFMSALDEPGEWYLDRRQGYIYYMPLKDEDMSSAVCYAPTLQHWILFKGANNDAIKNITFENLSFKFSSYLLPKEGEKPEQAAVSAPAAMLFDFSENISFIDCEMMHTGAYAMWFRRGCHNNVIDHCYLADLGAGGVKIGEPFYRNDHKPVSNGNIINNTIITHAGSELPAAVGIVLLQTSDNKITHNEISDIRYSGISIGWTWGYNNSAKTGIWGVDKYGKSKNFHKEVISPAVRNLVEYNHIHHIGWGELSDMGAIYTLGESHGTKISYNIIHDVWSYDYGGWGLYTDEGSSGIEMTSNLVYRCKSGGFHQHFGKNNKIENNIFAYGYYYQIKFTRPEPHLSFSFKRNIILYQNGEVLAGNGWTNGKVDMDKNLYYGPEEKTGFMGMSFNKWRKEREPHSIMADPMFRNSKHDEYSFVSLKNVNKIGFNVWDYSIAGVYGSDEWKQKAVLPADIIEKFNKAAALRMNK